ncbi:hypothetical protein V5799_010451 [Amblyomma americanum]|uniref:Uncharacterized protein n=1 Tax=Amblyomma americanum TaxID=6943 RepID=A0AAQ4EJR4_AMBAM
MQMSTTNLPYDSLKPEGCAYRKQSRVELEVLDEYGGRYDDGDRVLVLMQDTLVLRYRYAVSADATLLEQAVSGTKTARGFRELSVRSRPASVLPAASSGTEGAGTEPAGITSSVHASACIQSASGTPASVPTVTETWTEAARR